MWTTIICLAVCLIGVAHAQTRPATMPGGRAVSAPKCGPDCKPPHGTCAKRFRCVGPKCSVCVAIKSLKLAQGAPTAAPTVSSRPPNPTDIAKMIATKAAEATAAAAARSAAAVPQRPRPMTHMMSPMVQQQQQPYDFFSDMFGFGGQGQSGGGWGGNSMGGGFMGSRGMGGAGGGFFGMPFNFNSLMGMSMLGMDGLGLGF